MRWMQALQGLAKPAHEGSTAGREGRSDGGERPKRSEHSGGFRMALLHTLKKKSLSTLCTW